MSGDKNRDRERAELQAELERLIALQRRGELPLLDTGRFIPFSFATAILEMLSPSDKKRARWVN